MPRRLAPIGSKLNRVLYDAIASEMCAAANIPDAAERLAAAMAEAAGEMRQHTGYISLVFTLAKAVADAVVVFLANCTGGKGMPTRIVESQASASGIGGGQVVLVESQASAVGNGGVLVLTRLEAVHAEHRAAWQQIQAERVDAALIGQMRADPTLVEENRNILVAAAAARVQATGEEEGGEAGMEDEDMQDADAGQEEEDDDDVGMPQAFYEDYMPDSDEDIPTMSRARVNPQSRKRVRCSSFRLDWQIDRLAVDLVVGN